MAKRILIIVLLFIVFLVAVFAGYRLTNKPKPTPVATYELTGEKQVYPFGITWDPAEKLIISGIVEKNSLEPGRVLTLVVPASQNSRSVKVEANFYPNAKNLLVLTLDIGKQQETYNWNVTDFADIAPLIKPGTQVILYMDMDESPANDLIGKAQQEGLLQIGPVSKMAIAVP